MNEPEYIFVKGEGWVLGKTGSGSIVTLGDGRRARLVERHPKKGELHRAIYKFRGKESSRYVKNFGEELDWPAILEKSALELFRPRNAEIYRDDAYFYVTAEILP